MRDQSASGVCEQRWAGMERPEGCRRASEDA
jgi:hypothetical protein